MTAIQGSNCAPTGASNPAVATQSQSAGGWYNPLPNPYAYGLPSNGGIVGGLGMNGMGMYGMGMNGMGMYGGGFGGGFGGQYGPGLINPAVAAYGGGFNTNMYGGYNYQNNNPNSALPGYGYDSVVAPTTFASPLSGDGTAPNSAGDRIYQEDFVKGNQWAAIGLGIGTGLVAGTLAWGATLGRSIKRGAGAKLGLGLSIVGCSLAGIGAFTWANQKFSRAIYTGLDKNDNGHNDGSWTIQRGFGADITKI
jgi:hypothetical protein